MVFFGGAVGYIRTRKRGLRLATGASPVPDDNRTADFHPKDNTMNRLVSRLSALAIAELCAASAAARTVSVASVGESAAALAFGDADGKTYRLVVCYGDEDGGATTAGWDACDVLGSVGAAETSRTVALPAGWGSAATHLRFFLLTPEIPEDATRVEYLQSSGSQFIDTGVRGRVGVEAEIDVAAVSMGDKTILGCRKDSGDTRFYPVHWANNKWWKGWLRSGTYWSTRENDIALGTRYHVRSVFKSGEQAFYVDGVSKGTPTSEVSDFDSGLDMYLFAANKYGSDVFQQASAKIYAAKIWLDGDLKREFVPCLDPNEKPALYDRVSGNYFYNGGTGADFATGGTMSGNDDVSASSATVSPSSRSVTVVSAAAGSAALAFGTADGKAYRLAVCYGDEDGGADTNAWDNYEVLGTVAAADTSRTVALPAGWGKSVSHLRYFLLAPEIPDGATRVEYLESTGAQFIDTGIRGKVGISADLDHSWTSAADKTLLGSRNGSSHRFFVFHNNKGRLGYGLDGTFAYYKGAADTSYDTRYLALAKMLDGEQSLVLDGTPYGTAGTISSSFDSGNDMYLFGCNDNGSLALSASAKVYSAKIWEGDTLVRWFVPCLDPNGTPAMYDRATGDWFRNGGTGTDFATGGAMAAALTVSSSSATVAAPLQPSVRYAYLESDGQDDYVDLGVVGKDGTKMFADMEWVAIPTDGVFCGARKDSGDTRFFLYSSYQNVQRYGYASGNPTVKKNGSSVRQSTGVRYRVTSQLEARAQTIAIQKFEDGAWVDDAANADTAAGPVDTGLPLYLFARDMAGTADSFCAARVYSLKLWQKDGNGDYRLVRHLVPAKTSDGAAALWDRVTETWFFNAAGAGALAAGAESPWPDGFVISIW